MRISRSEPIATSKRVTKAAPLRQRFSLEVSSSKAKPCASRPRTFSGRRTEILRSERCFETVVLASGTMGWVLDSGDRSAVNVSGDRYAAHHDGVAAGFAHHSNGVFGLVDVTVADHGNIHGLLDGGDNAPVGGAGVALFASARVDGDGFDADALRHFRDVDRNNGI